jgi:hypothetical protein
MKMMLLLKKPMPHVWGIDCHLGKSTNNKKGSSNHEQLQIQLINIRRFQARMSAPEV